MIDHTSFARYQTMTTLSMLACSLVYVKNGTFDLLWNLNYINFMYNKIIEFPENFGLASGSITKLQFWDAFNLRTLPPFYFRNFTKLTYLNIGHNSWSPFDRSILPKSLTSINLNYARLPKFPNFTGWTPVLNEISIPGNRIQILPAENLQNVNVTVIYLGYNRLNSIPEHSAYPYIEKLYLKNNKLTSLPDFFNTTLHTLSLSSNPLICNLTLCWLRMRPWFFDTTILTDVPTCAYPDSAKDMPLMEVNPAIMGCYNGKWYILFRFRDLLPDTQNCWLPMDRECRERFSRPRLQRKPLVSDPSIHHGACVTHVPWCMPGSLTIIFTYLERGPWTYVSENYVWCPLC